MRTDAEVARLIGRHPHVVAKHRRRLGIPALRRRRPWTRAEDRLLGTLPDPAVGKRIGRLPSTVGHRRRKLGIARHPQRGAFTPEEDRLLGTMPDPQVARRLHRSLASVHATAAAAETACLRAVQTMDAERGRSLRQADRP